MRVDLEGSLQEYRQAHTLVAAAAEPMRAVVRAIVPEQLGGPTPCQEYDVRGLLNHLLFWGPSLVGAATDARVRPPADSEEEVELTGGDWAAGIEAQLDQLAAAWGEPEAWEGTTRIVGPDPMPAPMIGGMVLTELVVHGWDLARAVGQRPQWDEPVVAFVYAQVAQTAELGREMRVYGPAVPVPDSAALLDRALGRTGRDPDWKA
jgi:uncharacterized protein (TIGR03086 family)